MLDKAVQGMKHKRLRKILISASIFCFVFANASCFAHATDPVSAATMANALAQAITAYGASQGVSMTYDVTNTDGIGEGMHDLWEQFKEDVNDNNIPTYDSFAVTVWSTLYSKVNNHVAINLADTSVSYLDSFWNWLLSGPAEMTKVDNEYYEWSIDSQTGNVLPISVYSYSYLDFNGNTVPTFSTYYFIRDGFKFEYTFSSPVGIYAALNGHYYYFMAIFSNSNGVPSSNLVVYNASNNNVVRTESNVLSGNSSYGGSYRYKQLASAYDQELTYYVNTSVFTSSSYDPTSVFGAYNSNTTSTGESGLSVQPYIGDSAPQNVYIPDNEDVNYAPLPYIGELDIPWSDSLYGDGTGTLTDAQSEAIAGDLSSVIEQDTTLTIAEAQDDVIANEVYIPFLPVTLPSFNFSFSGIWHYVVTWVSSLGAWFTTLFTIWSCLPYAMVVPVYATLVVVIVLGVYRRFLA